MSDRNLTPSSVDPGSPSSALAGVAVAFQIVHGQVRPAVTVTVTPADGAPMLPLSSKARLFRITEPDPPTVHWNDQLVVPVADFQVLPPSVDTSTPTTTPPPVSDADPLMVTALPEMNEAPAAGLAMTVVGPVVSLEAVAGVRPDWRLPGCEPMSASRFTIACFIRTSAAALPRSCVASRPHDH